MARIPTEQIDRIKQEISLLRLIESEGHKVTRQGKDFVVLCPFHDEKTPSCVISPKTNLYHCFGCGAAGSVIDWVMHSRRLPFRGAVEWLTREFFPGEVTETDSSFTAPARPAPAALEHPCSLAAGEDDQALLQRVIHFYHETLKQSQEAQDYLKARGLDDPELINTFKLGYANRTLGLKLPEKTRKAGAEIRTQLQRIGLYRESGHEHFNGSLVIPIINTQGEVSEVYGRKLLNNLRKGTPKHLYLPGPHVGVFNPDCLHGEEIILCESLIDALTFWRWGFRNVTTSYGTQGFTDELLEAFKQSHVQRVLIAYDRDAAGNTASEPLVKQLTGEGIECYRILFPKGMDANEYALKMSPARKSLELVIRQAEFMGKGSDPCLSNKPQEASVALPASPTPKISTPEIDAQVTDHEVIMVFADRRYRVRGWQKSASTEQLKINLAASKEEGLHVDQLDLYNAKQRYSFVKQSAIELGVADDVIKKDLGKVLLKLEQLQDEHRQAGVKSKDQAVELSNEEQEQALSLLKDPNLLNRILEDFHRAGVVGEETNKLVGYLAAVSRKLDNPLAVIIQSTSAAGKSSLMNAVLSMMPEEERIQYSAMTGQSLFYMGETNLKHKILAIAEEEGAESASYALKLLQSEGELTIASTGKDAEGNLTTQEYRVEGPVMLFSTTTAIDIDEELMNRCMILTVNESREQTQLIHQLQRERETLEGLLADEDRKKLIALHRNAQRLLKPLKVVNPFAQQLTFMDNQTRSRRDHMKYLRLIKTIALLHQYQREIKTVDHNGETLEYVEVELSDIAVANELAHDVLGRSLDELPPQTRKLLTLIYQMVTEVCKENNLSQKDVRFSRRDIRDGTGWSDNQLKVHCRRLEELEYLLVHRGSRGHSIEYELLFSGDTDHNDPQLMGLIDTTILKKHGSDVEKLGLLKQKLGSSCPQVGSKLVGGCTDSNAKNALYTGSNADLSDINGKTHNSVKTLDSSYRTHSSPLAAQAGV